jgi:hypothetical protein
MSQTLSKAVSKETRYVVYPGLHILINSCPGSSMLCAGHQQQLNNNNMGMKTMQCDDEHGQCAPMNTRSSGMALDCYQNRREAYIHEHITSLPATKPATDHTCSLA